jgi:hypothetical protein
MAKVNAPIFIIGCNNSGSTVLAKILTRQPTICSLPLMENPDTYGQYHHLEMQDLAGLPKKLTRWTGKQTARLWAINEFQGFLKVTEADYTPSLGRRTKAILSQFGQKGKRLVLTSPANLLRVKLLLSIFPDAQFITLVRNPYPVVEGTIRKRLYDPQRPWISGMATTVAQAAEQWENANVLLLSLQRFLTDQLLIIVHYEDLVTRPKVTLGQILEFLGLSDKNAKAPRLKRNLNERQSQRLTAHEREVVERICWPMMDHFGYQRPKPQTKRV